MKQIEFDRRFAGKMGLTEGQLKEVRLAFNRRPGSVFLATHRGPGGGPDATWWTATLLLLTSLHGGPRVDAPDFLPELIHLPLEGAESDPALQAAIIPTPPLPDFKRCSVTGAVEFGAALHKVLARSSIAGAVDRIEMRRGLVEARIIMRDGSMSRFVTDANRDRIEALTEQGTFRTVATIGGAVLAEIAEALTL